VVDHMRLKQLPNMYDEDWKLFNDCIIDTFTQSSNLFKMLGVLYYQILLHWIHRHILCVHRHKSEMTLLP